MAEHRRVEPRPGLVGTGMATDVDRLHDLDAEYERHGRAWRDAPEKAFGAVLEEAPASGELEQEEQPDPRRRPKRPKEAPTEAEMAAAATAAPAAPVTSPAAPAPPAPTPGPRVPPDPRAALLHKMLATGTNRGAATSRVGSVPEPVKVGGAQSDTPPTGSAGDRKRRP